MPPRDANVRHMLNELESLGEKITQWEQRFLEDITDHVDRGGKLNEEQKKKLEQIYGERVK